MITFTLPWPDKRLSPNARVHWAIKARAAKMARTAAFYLAKLAIMPHKPDWNRVAVSMVFCPPDNRRRDRDNLIASMKAATDGIADALVIDDSRFVVTYAIGEVVRGGAVRVTLADAGAQREAA